MKTNEEMDIYVQPDCKVIAVEIEHLIAASDTSAQSNEEYETGDTSNWF